MTPAIRVENLCKSYRLGQMGTRAGYRTLRESLARLASRPLHGRRDEADQAASDLFWAIQDVCFNVDPGEVVGIIGRNGAGKSTLLKILSRITKPTTGRALLKGRIGSLLEVGTGFHPELTGRENIYLNGSILGMSRREITRQFDEIVAFAEVEQFLDTPVKRYSSGMYVRLAFAVAAHLNPEILVIDEVLAVGDQEFQKKCLGKMSEVSRSGRTVLFVSHNMPSVEALCDRCILLSRGTVACDGSADEVIAEHMKSSRAPAAGRTDLRSHPGRTSDSLPMMTDVTLSEGDDEPISDLRMGSGLSIQVRFTGELHSPFRPVLGVVVKTSMGAPIFGANNRFIPGYGFGPIEGSGHLTCRFDRIPLMPGLYTIDLYLGNDTRDLDVVHDAISFNMTAADVFGSGKLPPAAAGPIYLPASWELELKSEHKLRSCP